MMMAQTIGQYGAVGDDNHDDAPAFQAALNASSASTCVTVPSATYALQSALTATHPFCLIGSAWRLHYKGTGSMTAVLTTNFTSYGGQLAGVVIDGGGYAAAGLAIKNGWINGTVSHVRVTNVTDAGFLIDWAQLMMFDNLTVSGNVEPFSVVPTTGIRVGPTAPSNRNTFINPTVEHVSGTGIDFQYSSNSSIIGGTSEGNAIGISCAGADSPYRFCNGNVFQGLDTEENSVADYVFGVKAAMNTVIGPNSSGMKGGVYTRSIHFVGDGGWHSASGNVVVGGLIGPSIADAGTRGNKLIGVSADMIPVGGVTPPIWTDNGTNGANWADPIINKHDESVSPSKGILQVGTGVPAGGFLCKKPDNTLGTCVAPVAINFGGPVSTIACTCQ